MRPPDPFAVIYLRSGGAGSEEEERRVARAAEEAGGAFQVLEWRELEAGRVPALETGAERRVLVGSTRAVAALGEPPRGASLIVLSDGGDAPADLPGAGTWLAAVVSRPVEEAPLREAMRRASSHSALLCELQSLRERVANQGRELKELNRIGVALSAEKNIDTLLGMILSKCREITCADAGSLYLVERRPEAEPDDSDYFADKDLVFRLAQNDTVQVSFREFRMEVSRRSLAGFVALTGESLRIDDAYAIPEDREYGFNRSFDESSGYRTRSLLIIPMGNHKGEITGVLQLINRKRRWDASLAGEDAVEAHVIPFDARTTELASSLASQAAVAIENARLYQEIQNLFEGFIRASVTAIESRDPTTSGHSERVASFTVDLAEKVDREETGPMAAVRFDRDQIKEIKYASLLHDFGKIGVRENVLLKGKKLYPHELGAIESRFRFIRRSLELKYARRKLDLYATGDSPGAARQVAALDEELARNLERIDRYLALIVEANEPSVLKKEASRVLEEVAATSIEGMDGEVFRLLDDEEAANLAIPKGSLSQEERLEIESHVTHTFEFLSNIPWTRELASVPRIAGAHHEKLDGSGYPFRMAGTQIPLQSKIMTIADIFDALTARDRPYKKAIPRARALDILSYEVKEGKVDGELFRIFVEGKVFEAAGAGASPS